MSDKLSVVEVCWVVGREAERERVRGVSGDISPYAITIFCNVL